MGQEFGSQCSPLNAELHQDLEVQHSEFLFQSQEEYWWCGARSDVAGVLDWSVSDFQTPLSAIFTMPTCPFSFSLSFRAAFSRGWTQSEEPATMAWSRGSTGTATASTPPIADPSTSTAGRYPSESVTVGDLGGLMSDVETLWLPGGRSFFPLCGFLFLWRFVMQLFCGLGKRLSHYADLKCDAETLWWTLSISMCVFCI